MDFGEILKGFVLDTWYKVFVAVGVVGLFIGLTTNVKGISNRELLTLSLGLLGVGIGRWIDQRKTSHIKPPNAYTGGAALITQHFWSPSPLGVVFDLVGGIFLVVFVVNFIFNSPNTGSNNVEPTAAVTSTTSATQAATLAATPG